MPNRKNPSNPLKNQGQSKARTRALSDRAQPSATRRPVADTVTAQGGSEKGGRGAHRGPFADNRHPSQHGGVKADDPAANPLEDTSHVPAGTKRRGPSPADLPSSDRTGTAPHPGASRRSGKTDGERSRRS